MDGFVSEELCVSLNRPPFSALWRHSTWPERGAHRTRSLSVGLESRLGVVNVVNIDHAHVLPPWTLTNTCAQNGLDRHSNFVDIDPEHEPSCLCQAVTAEWRVSLLLLQACISSSEIRTCQSHLDLIQGYQPKTAPDLWSCPIDAKSQLIVEFY